MDGYGLAAPGPWNAVSVANTPNLDALFAESPNTTLSASGLDVGLPDGQIGNSEVGHTNIGAGRVVFQDLPRISRAIEDGSFFENPVLISAGQSGFIAGRVVVMSFRLFLSADQFAGFIIAGLCVLMTLTLRNTANKLLSIAGVIMLMGFNPARRLAFHSDRWKYQRIGCYKHNNSRSSAHKSCQELARSAVSEYLSDLNK